MSIRVKAREQEVHVMMMSDGWEQNEGKRIDWTANSPAA